MSVLMFWMLCISNFSFFCAWKQTKVRLRGADRAFRVWVSLYHIRKARPSHLRSHLELRTLIPPIATMFSRVVIRVSKEIYKGESKTDNYQTKLKFLWHLRTLLSHLMQLQLSSSNKMTYQLLPGTIRRQGCSVALDNSWLIYFALSFIYISPWVFQWREKLSWIHCPSSSSPDSSETGDETTDAVKPLKA